MRVIAFDAKPFERGKPFNVKESGDRSGAGAFKTQLGVGVVVSDKEAFKDRFTIKFAELCDSFKFNDILPFCPSSRLLDYGRIKATAFSDQLVKSVQDLIEKVHCFYVILPPNNPNTIRVGGIGNTTQEIPTWLFVKNLGPMFSYMTAQNYLYKNSNVNVGNTEFHIDAFSSKQTRAWDILVNKVKPKVFWRGDECNPFIACADMIAFLTDIKLYSQYLKLYRYNIAKVWKNYTFKTSVHYATHDALAIHAWYTDKAIDVWPYIAKPTVFLAIDGIIHDHQTGNADDGNNTNLASTATDPPSTEKPKTISKIFAKSPVYAATARYAFNLSASFKLFSRYEDIAHIRDHDIFVYGGPQSEKIGRVLQDTLRINLMSGLELRDKVEKV